jgi:pantoate--beta-alanine ligase
LLKQADDFRFWVIYMIIFKKTALFKNYLAGLRKKGTIGFVPTMGALHEGHLLLVERSLMENQYTLCSIFINPTQFNDPQDFHKYPVSIESDVSMLEKQGCHVVFLPSVDEIYPQGSQKSKWYNLGEIESVLEGKFRPGHFQGVCKVVDVLVSITEPDHLYLGQKDYQQCMVIRKMLDLTGRSTGLVVCETVREKDGLAMSSRNRRLPDADREKATGISRSLLFAREHLSEGPLEQLKRQAMSMLEADGFKPDYFEFAHARTLQILDHWNGKDPVVALVAAFLGEVRLIDNMILNSPPPIN